MSDFALSPSSLCNTKLAEIVVEQFQIMARAANKTVLLIDDAPEIHGLAGKHLQGTGLKLIHASSGLTGLELVAEAKPDLILLDYSMPDLDGLSLLRILKSSSRLASIPVVMITAAEDQSLITSTFDSGAADYVRKPFNATELRARVMSALNTQAMIAKLQTAAETDALTGLLNLRSISHRINSAASSRSLHDKISALLYIDLDNFKVINDSLGHTVGDRMIIETARRIEQMLIDTLKPSNGEPIFDIARVGGDEYIIYVRELNSLAEIRGIADKLLSNLNRSVQCGDRHFYSSASIGISHAETANCKAEQLILQADIALYAAKAAGKHCWRAFDESLKRSFEQRVTLEADLRKACQTMDFHVVYQPIMHLEKCNIVSVEALLRWDHPEHGVVSPTVFIPIAEATGLINPLGDWCMQTSIEQFARWRYTEPAIFPKSISVNIARQQLLQVDFIDRALTYVRDSKLEPRQVQLEVTETEVMTDFNYSVAVMNELRRAGFRIAIDDFGTGYSSLACLDRFPVDTLKIDKSIIADICTKHFSAKLVELVMKLAVDTGISVVAEGIETRDQRKLLSAWGCELGQGFLLAKPMLPESMPTFASRSSSETPGRWDRINYPGD